MFFEKLTSAIVSQRKVLLLAVLILSVVFGWAASKIVVNNSNDEFFVKSDPSLHVYKEFQKVFGNEEFLMVYIDNGDVFSPSSFKRIHSLVEQMRALKFDGKAVFTEVLSPFDAPIISSDDESISVSPSLKNQTAPTQAELDQTKALMINHPLYRNLLVNTDGRVAAVVGTMQPGKDDRYAVTASKALENLLQKPPINTLSPLMVGGPALKMHLDQATAKESAVFGAAAIFMCILVMLLMFRRFEQVFSTILVLVLSVIWTLGIMSFLHVEMTLVTIILPLVIVITGLGTCVHLVASFRRRIQHRATPQNAIVGAFGENGEACLYTSITSAVGFLSMISAPVSPMRSMGIFAAVGIMVTYLLTFILLPTILGTRISIHKDKQTPLIATLVRDKFFGALASVSLRNPLATTVICAIIALTMASGVFFVKVESNFVQALNKNHPQRVAIEKVDQNLGGTSTLEVILDTGKPGGVYEPGFIKLMTQLGQWLLNDKSDTVTAVISPLLILSEANRAFKGEAKPPETKEAATQLMFLYEISGGSLRSIVSSDAQIARMSVRTRTISTSRELALEREIAAKVSELWPLVDGNFKPNQSVKLTGVNSLFVHLSEYVVNSQLNSFASAGLIIALLMMWLLRSWRLGLMTMLPNALPILATYGMMGWLGIPIDWLSAVIPGVALGVAVDDTIHIASQFEKARAKGNSPYEAAHHVIQTIGRAITVSTLALCAGFCVFAFSILDSLMRVGLLLAFALLLALIANLVMTPAILALVKDKS